VTGANTITGTYKTQYYLTVNSAYDTLDGQGWYDSGTTAYATLASGTVSGGAGTQYVFTGWSGDASGTALTSNGITMDGPKTATANWKTQYYLTISVSPSGSGTATPVPVGPWYDSGTPVQVTAMPASGYTFGSWLLDGSSPAGSTITPITVTMNAPHNLVAQFLSPNAIKSSVLQDLITLRDGGTVTDKGDLNKLDEAIKHLTKSLDPELWADETHLQTKHGEKVFNEEKDAVVKLVELMKDKKSTIPDATLQGFIDRLVNADRLLVSAAIHDVVTAGGDPKKINKANEELSKGDARALDGKFVDAIEHYRNAWNHAIQSV
jgi:uncharacterized repeat protein (TIGR02543 family)